jgi:hypothetical protein
VEPFVLQNYHQVFSQKHRVIKVRIGKPISVAEQNEYKTTELYSEFLRKDLHVGNPYDKEKNY